MIRLTWSRFLSLIGSIFPVAAFVAQEIKPVTSDTPGDQATLVLNPFVVNTSKDSGYSASSTLAGTRLNTPIADLGASISILTKDFLDDIGATSVNDALIYAVGMEAGGPGGNFSGATGGDITNASVQSDDARNEPQGVTRARGLGSANLTRGFFATDIASDAYTLDRITINRDASGAIIIDRTKPYFAPGETNVDLFASYGRRVWKDKIDWRVQINVRNALGTDTLIPINAQYDGTVASYRVPPEKRIYLTNTFTF
jgi:hypothetical protein